MTGADPAALGSAAAAAFAGFLFARAALHKLADFTAFTGFVEDYRLVPPRAVPLVSAALAGAEVAVVLAMILPGARAAGLMLGAALLAGYGVAIAVNVARGRTQIECGCGGAVQPLSVALVLRNAVLGALLLAGVAAPGAGLAAGEAVAAIAAGLVGFAVYLMADQLLSNAAHVNRSQAAGKGTPT